MSSIAIYRPSSFVAQEAPSTIPFPRIHKSRTQDTQNPVVDRARMMHANRCCPECGSVAVNPLELNDALLNASSRFIPGTATVVAFHCNGCYHQWSGR
ncbi:MAG: hypothetical protein JKY95_15810 [Planctomycetaceae bacterium]|nr:hypothetical protein [Planctomycetaceae bacterium]